MNRPPLALKKMRFVETSGTAIYRAKMHATLKRNFEVLPGVNWLQLLIQYNPDKHEHTFRYYDAYSSPHRTKHGTPSTSERPALEITDPDTEIWRSARAAWVRLTYRVYYVVDVCFVEQNTSIAKSANGRSCRKRLLTESEHALAVRWSRVDSL